MEIKDAVVTPPNTDDTKVDDGTPETPSTDTKETDAKPDAPADGDDKPPAEKEKADADAKPDAETETPEGAPESYGDFTLPEGVTLEGDRKEMVTTLSKEMNLSKPKAQQMIDAYLKLSGMDNDASAAASEAAWDKQIADGEAELKKQWGADFDKNTIISENAKKAAISEADLKYFEKSGITKTAEFKRLMFTFGQKLSEDSMERGEGGDTALRKRGIKDLAKFD